MRRSFVAVFGAILAGIFLVACTSSPPRRGATVTSSTAAGPTGPTLGPGTAVTNGSTSAPSTTAGGPGRCEPGSLKGAFTLVPGGASAGHVVAQIMLTNDGASACTMSGYIGMQLLGSSGALLPTNVVRVPGNEQVVALPPGASAVVIAQFSPDMPGAGDATSGPCQPVATSTRVTPPDDTQYLVVPGPNSSVCQRGTINIQPVETAAASGQ